MASSVCMVGHFLTLQCHLQDRKQTKQKCFGQILLRVLQICGSPQGIKTFGVVLVLFFPHDVGIVSWKLSFWSLGSSARASNGLRPPPKRPGHWIRDLFLGPRRIHFRDSVFVLVVSVAFFLANKRKKKWSLHKFWDFYFLSETGDLSVWGIKGFNLIKTFDYLNFLSLLDGW